MRSGLGAQSGLFGHGVLSRLAVGHLICAGSRLIRIGRRMARESMQSTVVVGGGRQDLPADPA